MSGPKRAAAGPKTKRRGLKVLLGLVAALLVPVLALAGFYGWHMFSAVQKIPREAGLLPKGDSDRVPEPEIDTLNIMIMGSDSRGDGDPGRSDVLMLAHVPSDNSKVYLVSFPRDLYVEIPGRKGKDKINHAFAYGGPPLTVLTMEHLLGIRIDHVIKIDFDGFIGITETLGGVTVNNPVASSGRKYSFPKGEITISGEQALTYVRERKNLPGGTVDRAERQRVVVKAVLRKIMTREVLANPAKFGEIVGELGGYVVTDDELTPGEMFSIASSMRITGGDDIRLMMAPISGFGRDPKNRWIDIPHEEKMPEMAQALQKDKLGEYYEKYKDAPLVG